MKHIYTKITKEDVVIDIVPGTYYFKYNVDSDFSKNNQFDIYYWKFIVKDNDLTCDYVVLNYGESGLSIRLRFDDSDLTPQAEYYFQKNNKSVEITKEEFDTVEISVANLIRNSKI